jgi:small subunit ribosomal protein S33
MASNYAKRMAFLSAKIFGEVARPTNTQSMKVVKIMKEKPLNLREDVVQYYPRHPAITVLMSKLRFHGLFR